jgi:NitT/TauT family transport system permease protein
MNFRKYLLPCIPIAGFFLCWQCLTSLGFIDKGLFSSPLKILDDMRNLFLQQTKSGSSVLVNHITATLWRLLLASLAGFFAGLLTGICMGVSRRFYAFVDPIVSLIVPIPGIAMAPLFIVWLGFGDVTIITVGAIAAFFPVAYNVSTGIRSVDRQLVRAARLMGSGRLRTVLCVHLPWATVYMLTGLKLGLARCWRTVVAVELVAAADWGLGYMVWDGAEHLRAGIVFGGIILLALLFVLIEKGLLDTLEKKTVVRWGMVRN